MMKKRLVIGLAALLTTLGTGAFASDIYKWTDEDGNVHYGDRPTGSQTEERLKVSSDRTDQEALNDRKQSFDEAEQSRKDARAQAKEDKQQAEEDRLAAEEHAAACDTHRQRIDKMKSTPRVYRVDETGEREYLDETQREQAIASAEAELAEKCS